VRILVVQLKRIGDLVLTTPVLDCLRDKYPAASLSLAIEEGSAGLIPCIAHDETFVFRRGRLDVAVWLRLLRKRFDLVIDLTGNDRSAAVTAFSRPTRSVTYAKWRKRFLRGQIYSDFVESKVSHLHTADHHTALLRAIGMDRVGIPGRLEIPPEDAEAVAELLERKKIQRPFAVVHPGTVKPEKYWLPDRWVEVINSLRSRGYAVVLTGSPAASEAAHLHDILSRSTIPDSQVVCVAGKLTLPQLAAMIKKASLVCGVDSAPLHFADALETPVLGLFGPTCPHQWRPRLAASVVVTPKGTARVGPEYYPGIPMNKLTTDLALAALDELLS